LILPGLELRPFGRPPCGHILPTTNVCYSAELARGRSDSMSVKSLILSRDWNVTTHAYGLVIGFIAHLCTQLVTTNSASSYSVTAALHYSTYYVFSADQWLLGSGFQRQMFPFLWVPELSPCLRYQLPTAAVLQLTRSSTNSLTPFH
jgi:hypothetical protein